MLRETHHAVVLENWGVLWMWHSLKIFLLCAVTTALAWDGVSEPVAYLCSVGGRAGRLGRDLLEAAQRGGPVLFVERQIAHVWAAGVAATSACSSSRCCWAMRRADAVADAGGDRRGWCSLVKAGMLSGAFYVAAGGAVPDRDADGAVPAGGALLFGTVSAGCFFFPGLVYHRRRMRNEDRA